MLETYRWTLAGVMFVVSAPTAVLLSIVVFMAAKRLQTSRALQALAILAVGLVASLLAILFLRLRSST